MPFDPDLDEMQTTTQRNRAAKPKKGKISNFEGKKAPPFTKKSAHMDKFADYEGSPQDEMEDARGAKRMGVSKKEYEGTPEDEAEDRKGAAKSKGHVGIAIMISPMSNPAAEHRSSIRNSINKSINQIKRRK